MEQREQKRMMANPLEVHKKPIFREYFGMTSQIKKEEERLVQDFTYQRQVLFSSINLFPQDSREFINEWDLKHQKLLQAQKSLIQKVATHPDGNTLGANSINNILTMATKFLIADNLERAENLARKKGLLSFGSFSRLIELSNGCMYIDIKREGLSLRDILNNPNIPLSKVFKFLMDNIIDFANLDLIYDQIIDENKSNDNLTKYPGISAEKIQDIGVILELTPQPLWLFQHFDLNPQERTEKEIVSTAKILINIFAHLRDKIAFSLFDRSTPDFPKLKEMTSTYLNDERSRNLTVLFLTFNDMQTVSLFREAQSLSSQNDESADFYKLLANSIRDYKEQFSVYGRQTKDDLPTLIAEDRNLGEHIPSFEDLKKITASIVGQTGQKEYRVDPQKIEWHNLIPPIKISIDFPKGGPHVVSFDMYYESPEGETLDLRFVINTKKGRNGWSFLEHPNDPEMKEMKDTLMLVAKEILLDVKRQAEDKWKEKQKAKKGKMSTHQSSNGNGNKHKAEIPYIPKEKEEKTELERPLSPIQEALASDLAAPFAEKVKRNITLPQKEDLGKMMDGISPENQAMILDKIAEFNQEGKGRFKALTGYQTAEDRKVYELRTGNYRVLLTETSNENGSGEKIHEFEIYKIGDRREIFKKRQKN